MDRKFFTPAALALSLATVLTVGQPRVMAQDVESLGQEQMEEKDTLQDMRNELKSLKQDMNDAMTNATKQVSKAQAKEFHLIAKEDSLELAPDITASVLSYNGQSPGPTIRVQQGQNVRIILHNEMKSPTTLYFQGLDLPFEVDGLAKKEAGVVPPGQTLVYEFVANQPGTFWYHPQVMNSDQKLQGLYGALIVEPEKDAPYDKDYVYVLGQTTVKGPTSSAKYFTVNGKCAPAIPSLELTKGQLVRLRVINASGETIPLSLSGHRFEVVARNGCVIGDNHRPSDTVALAPAERVDLEFVANNPGVWSFASELPSQTTTNGKFPGGIAVVVRYVR